MDMIEKQKNKLPVGCEVILLEDVGELQKGQTFIVLEYLEGSENLKPAYIVESENTVFTIEEDKLKLAMTLEEFKELWLERRKKVIAQIERLELIKLQKLEEDINEEVALRLHKKFQSGQEIK